MTGSWHKLSKQNLDIYLPDERGSSTYQEDEFMIEYFHLIRNLKKMSELIDKDVSVQNTLGGNVVKFPSRLNPDR